MRSPYSCVWKPELIQSVKEKKTRRKFQFFLFIFEDVHGLQSIS